MASAPTCPGCGQPYAPGDDPDPAGRAPCRSCLEPPAAWRCRRRGCNEDNEEVKCLLCRCCELHCACPVPGIAFR